MRFPRRSPVTNAPLRLPQSYVLVLFVDPLDALAALDRLVAAIVRLTHILADPPATLAKGLARQLQRRLNSLGAQLQHVGIRLRAVPQPREPSKQDAPPAAERPPPPRRDSQPRPPGWLLHALPEAAPAIADEFRAALQDPAMAALLAEDPAFRRLLQPLCHLFGLDLASFLPTAAPREWLPLPYPRFAEPAPDPAPHPAPAPPQTRPDPPPREILAS